MKTVTVRKTFLNAGKVVRPGTDDNPNRITITNSRALALAKRGMVSDLEDAAETSEEEKREQFAAGLPKARISSDPESDTVTIVFPSIEIAQTFREVFALMQRHTGEFVRPSTGAITSESFDLTSGRGEGDEGDDGDQTNDQTDDQAAANGDDAGADGDQGGEGDREGAEGDDQSGAGDETGADDTSGASQGDHSGDVTEKGAGEGDVVIEKPDDAADKPGETQAPAARRPRGQRKPGGG